MVVALAASPQPRLESHPLRRRTTHHDDLDLVAGLEGVERIRVRLQIRNRSTPQLHDNVTRFQARRIRWTSRSDSGQTQPRYVARGHVGDGAEVDVRTSTRAGHRG